MPVEPWGGYPPELNAGRYMGTGPEGWLANATTWLSFAAMVEEAAAIWLAEAATMEANWQGTAPASMMAAVGQLTEWFAEAFAVAIANAGACTAVAVAYGAGMDSMIPQLAVNANRAAELIAEATNFLEINRPTITTLQMQYAEFWGQNAATMLTYDQAVTTATIPKPLRPPPMLTSLASAVNQVADAAAKSATQAAMGAATNSAMQSTQGATQGASTAAEAPSSMGGMMGQVGQFASMPTQALGQLGSVGQLASPAQGLMEPLTSLLGNMSGNVSGADGAAIGGGSESVFDGVPVSGGGGADIGGGGVGPVGIGGGLGGSMMSPGAYMGASGPAVRSQPVFNGVAAQQSELVVEPGIGGAPGGGGGLYGGGTAPAAAHAPAVASAKRARDSIPAIPIQATLPAESKESEELFA
ncbi:PPE family protein [Mycolicibacterium llatzerense]|uniref:PPE family protein n=1 Tax=Mycolicibacterium llatzerense TaxID=280871 RepID=UPI0008DCE5C5|nr:PPE family protein [Mycolicibacterium llatzerense]